MQYLPEQYSPGQLPPNLHLQCPGLSPELPPEIVQMIFSYVPHKALLLSRAWLQWAEKFIDSLPSLSWYQCHDNYINNHFNRQIRLVAECRYVRLILHLAGKYAIGTIHIQRYKPAPEYYIGAIVFRVDSVSLVDIYVDVGAGESRANCSVYRSKHIDILGYPPQYINLRDIGICIVAGNRNIFQTKWPNLSAQGSCKVEPRDGRSITEQLVQYITREFPEKLSMVVAAMQQLATDICNGYNTTYIRTGAQLGQ